MRPERGWPLAVTGRSSPVTPGNGSPLRIKAGQLKLYGSDTANANGSTPPIDPDEPYEPDEPEGEQPEDEEFDYSQLFKAPSYSEFIKTKPNSRAGGYERRVQSLMKAGLVMSLNNEQWADAATLLKHGPGFAKAAGNLAAEDAKAAAIVEMLTAPDSPYITFAMVALPMISQLFRNHQDQAKKAGETWRERRATRKAEAKAGKPKPSPITVRLFRREFKLPISFRLKVPSFKNIFSAFLTPTQRPEAIMTEVFNDPSVLKAIHKMGIFPRES